MHLTLGTQHRGWVHVGQVYPKIKDHPDASYLLFVHLFVSACMLTSFRIGKENQENRREKIDPVPENPGI